MAAFSDFLESHAIGIARIEKLQNYRWIVDASRDRSDIESGILKSNPLGLLNRIDDTTFKQRDDAFVAPFHRYSIDLQDIPEAEPLRIVRHPDDPELRFEQNSLADSNPLLIALDSDSGWQKVAVVAQILMEPFEDDRKRGILRNKNSRRQNQQQNTSYAAAHNSRMVPPVVNTEDCLGRRALTTPAGNAQHVPPRHLNDVVGIAFVTSHFHHPHAASHDPQHAEDAPPESRGLPAPVDSGVYTDD